MRSVSELAELAGVTVRTLHHYDEIGLLRPSGRTPAGYRLYDHDDLLRLQQIMFWRELGFTLAEIASALDDPDYDRAEALRDQRAELARRHDDLGLVLKAVDQALAELEGGPQTNEEEMFVAFDHSQYEDEVKERWGETDAYRQSRERTKNMTKADFDRLAAENESFVRRLAEAFEAGTAADSESAMDLAEEARRAISQFYECSHEMHVNLGEMYVADPRFTATYDTHAEGLAVWFRDAIRANADRAGAAQ
ncbi:MerR family transcriptional regulator [Euzebya pacifica]|jgi:DNA-binding transcriptional MerR regulator|uniref:MerR family transcriptional regulator n=1 Tax=Euzebya pacifica TaxID=1608957 RepID=UPI0030F83CED